MKKFLKIFLIAVALLSVAGIVVYLSLARMEDMEDLKEGGLYALRHPGGEAREMVRAGSHRAGEAHALAAMVRQRAFQTCD